MMEPRTATVQLKFSIVICYYSSNRVGSKNIIEVMQSHATEIQPRGIDQFFRSKELFLKVYFEKVIRIKIGMAYDI